MMSAVDREETEKVKKRYDRISPVYNQLEFVMERMAMAGWRQEFWEKVRKNLQPGDLMLEAGVGTGKNMPYYPEAEEVRIEAIDISPGMLSRAESRAEELGIEVNLRKMDIQSLDYPDNHFDLIVTSCVFCSVPDPVLGLKELKRVCKPAGKILMLEHMLSDKLVLKNLMNLLNFIPRHIWGANINRRTMENIERVGLKVAAVKNLWLDVFKEITLTP